jgi:hypothetical protein
MKRFFSHYLAPLPGEPRWLIWMVTGLTAVEVVLALWLLIRLAC